MKDIEKTALKYAVKNAFLHEFKADKGAVVGKLKALHSEAEMKEVIEVASRITTEVNSFSKEKIKKLYEEFEKEGFELKAVEKEKTLELPEGFSGEVITRFAPNPNGPFHLGSARAAILSHAYAEKFKGKFILRFDDTDPKVKRPIDNPEKVFLEDLEYIGCKVDKVFFASDRLEIYYEYLKKLIELDKIYACFCESEEWRKNIQKGKGCRCREKNKKDVLNDFEKMMKGEIKEGQAVLRIKTDLKNKDLSVRDWWVAKVVDKAEHPRVKENRKIWPSYNFASAIDDHLLGTTLIIRGQEHEQNETKQRFLYDYFGWIYPEAFYLGRLQLEKSVLSTSKIKEGIANGLYIGWDDPRLGTIKALRRRGIKGNTIRETILSLGVKSNDALIQWKTIEAINKKILKNVVDITVLLEPKEMVVEGKKILIEGKDNIGKLKKGKKIRLKESMNAEIVSETPLIAEEINIDNKESVVDWLSKGVKIKVMMQNAQEIEAIAHEKLKDLDVDSVVYLRRLGYCRIDEKKNFVSLWFGHT